MRARIAAAALLVVGCGSSSSGGGSTCAIVDGIYTFESVGSGGLDCSSGTYTNAWPPTVDSDAGTVVASCVPSMVSGQCVDTCSSAAGPTVTYSYSLTSSGFAGTASSPVDGADGGVAYTCTYTFSATRN
jgi:hypothetical protein